MTTARVSLLTSDDLSQQLLDQSGGSGADGLIVRKCRRALQQGLLEVSAHRRWNYDRRSVVLNTNSTQSTSTITYTHTGGASERLVTIAAGTFPAWAGRGWLLIANKIYRVASRLSSTTLSLDVLSNPGSNLAAGTSYTLFTKEYLLPFDCASILVAYDMTSRFPLVGITPQMYDDQDLAMYQAGTPQSFTVMGDPWVKGALCLKFRPIPDGRQIQYIYDRTQQPLRVWKYNTGTVTVSASSTSLAGTGTAFTSNMVGCVIRCGSTTTEPTSLEGAYPYLEERVITAVASATAATLDEAVDATYTAVKYTISDLCDVEPLAQRTAVINCAALHFARERNADSSELQRRSTAFVDALKLAMEADKRLNIHDTRFGSSYSGFPLAHSPTNAGYYA